MDRAEWLEQRKGFLGASEVAAVCGLDPLKSALDIWATKKGYATDEGSIAADMGNLFEAPLLSYYAARHKRTLSRPGTVVRGWMAATPDSVTQCLRNVQAKVVGARMLWHWADGAPDYVQAQTQAEMAVTGLAVTDVIACLGGTDYQEFEVKRDETTIGYLIEICSRFWQDNIVGGVMPDIDGSESARQILASRFPKPTADMLDAVPEFIEMAQRYHEIGRAIGTAKEEQDQLGNAMRLAIGDATGLKWGHNYVSWKPDKTGARRLYVHIKGAKHHEHRDADF